MSGLSFNEEILSVRCSAIYDVAGQKMFMVNYDLYDENVSKQCGFLLPEYSLAYNTGFTDGEITELIEYTNDNIDDIIDMARKEPKKNLIADEYPFLKREVGE